MTTFSYRSSFSQHNTFEHCARTWYYGSVLKIPTVQDFCHANAGTCIHKALDKYYTSETRDMSIAKEEFEAQWKKFNMDSTKLKLEKDEYWNMVLNGVLLNRKITSTELKIFYPEIVAYLDGVLSEDDEILDWKSSKRSEDNEIEYTKQLQLYSWLYYRKFGRMPKKATVHYLRYNGSKGILDVDVSEDAILKIEQWFYDILMKMQSYIAHPETLPPFNYNYIWCPYKAYWDRDGSGTASFVINIHGNTLQLEGPITELLEKGIVKKFSYELKNAIWIKKARPQANTTVCYWNSKNRTLPIGFKEALIVTLQNYTEYKKIGLALDIKDHRTFNDTKIVMPEKFLGDKQLREYQTEAVDIFLRKRFGILELGTGAGKTEISIETIRRLGLKTLFVVDKVELMRQTRTRITNTLGISVGQIGQGVDDIQDITVATIQTLNKNKDKYKEYLKTVRFVILDECHKVAANSYVQLSRMLLATEYRLGLSATAYRDDGNDMAIHAVAGNVIHSLGTKKLIENGWLVKPNIIFLKGFLPKHEEDKIEQECKVGLINEQPNYSMYYDKFIVNGERRNTEILKFIKDNPNKKILILTKIIEHGSTLQQAIPNSQHLFGGTPKDEREKMFNNFIIGINPVLISTISIFAEGIDVPSLDIVINASANKGDVKTVQVLGRVLRKLEGKNNAQYIDFIDNVKFFKHASLSRTKALKNEGHDVLFTEVNN